jgi:hypothetical protein
MATNKVKPQLLNVSQLAQIHLFHPATGKAIQDIVDYINKTVAPPQGNKIAKRSPRTSQI